MSRDIFVHNEDYNPDPFKMFDEWFSLAEENPSIKDATVFALSTSSKNGRPSVRMLLMKEHSHDGLMFFTNENSQKGKNLKANPQAEMCFYWEPIGKQVRIYGSIESVDDERSNQYFYSRHPNSQVGACISKQSSELESYSKLKADFDDYVKTHEKPQRPSYWHGFKLIPKEFEFWLDAPNRLHLRHKFTKVDSSWQHKFLYP